jgi:carbon-monoxide dehydrogenase large subunit
VPLENRDGTPRGETPRPMLAQGRVRHVGDPVALVVAETLEQAKDAAELIEVDYAARPHVVGTYEAAQPGAPLVHDHIKNNIVFDWEMGDRARTEAAFAKAAGWSGCGSSTSGWSQPTGRAPSAADAKDDRSTLWLPHRAVRVRRSSDMILKIGSPASRAHRRRGRRPGMNLRASEYPMIVASRLLKRTVKWIPTATELPVRRGAATTSRSPDAPTRIAAHRQPHRDYAALGAISTISAPSSTLAGGRVLVGFCATPPVNVRA